VEFAPEDAVSVPSDCGFQKCRVCKYIVRGEVERDTKLSDVYSSAYTPEPPESDEEPTEDEYGDQDGVENEQEDLDVLNSDQLGLAEGDPSVPDYNRGYEDGIKDGKAHSARKYTRNQADVIRNTTPNGDYDGFLSEDQYVLGYCDGYSDERSRQRLEAIKNQ
jgi:hypothetical protein